MNLEGRVCGAAAWCLAGFLLASCSATRAGSLEDWLDATRGGDFARPSGAEVQRAGKLFAPLLEGRADADAVAAWAVMGFRLEVIEDAGETFLGLAELDEQRRGRGAFLFRLGPAEPLVLQAPHRFHDRSTGKLTLQLMRDGRFRVAAWNSVSRRAGEGEGSDLARLPSSYFTALAEAIARHRADGWVVQIHGFERSKRVSAPGRAAQLIVSAGHRRPAAAVWALRDCLRGQLVEGVLVYPDEVRELGGTGNPVGAALRALGHDGFVHLELAAELRGELAEDRLRRRGLAACLAGIGS